MAKNSKYLAFDFGAESGRALLGTIENDKLRLEEIHRFSNTPVSTLGHLHWDTYRLFGDIRQGLRNAFAQAGGNIDGIGVDTWGVDFGLLGDDGELLGNPFHYRDSRTDGMMDELFKIVPREEVYERTGIQFMQLNSLYQLFAMVKGNSTALRHASTLLFMPDLFNYWLTGVKVSEFSIATTSQFYDPRAGDWARGMLAKLGIPTSILPGIVIPGATIGPLHESIVKELGAGAGVPVIAPATHDTGSAVVAVPAEDEDFAYLSSGTWSLMGVELDKPHINNQALVKNFTNEGGIGGTIRFLHNIMGLWIVQECRRTWLAAGEDISYGDLADMAARVDGFVSVINPNATRFLPPGDMPRRITEFCLETGQKAPRSKGEIGRCALDSLALAYRQTMDDLDELLNRKIGKLHIVGGGTQNKLLNQLTADAIGRVTITGPVEATAIGNVLAQAIGSGCVSDLSEARKIVRSSFEMTTYEPHPSERIEKSYELFRELPGA